MPAPIRRVLAESLLDVDARALQVRDERDDLLGLEARGPPCCTMPSAICLACARAMRDALSFSTASPYGTPSIAMRVDALLDVAEVDLVREQLR